MRKRGFVGIVVAACGCNGAATTAVVSSSSGVEAGTGVQDGSAPGSDAATTTSDAGSLPARWSCLGGPTPATPAGSVQVSIDVTNASEPGTQVAGAQVHACAALDVACGTPVTPTETTDDAGVALLSVPGGFDGYYEVSAPAFAPSLLSRAPQLSSESVAQGVTTISLLSAGASLAGVTQDPALGIAIVSASDCTSTPADGVVFSLGGSPGTNEQIVYLLNNLPSVSATQTDAVSGSALVFNVPPGALQVTASLASGGSLLRTVSTLARGGWVTYEDIRPDQATHPALP